MQENRNQRSKINRLFENVLNFHTQSFCQKNYFFVRNTTNLGFNLCNCIFSDIPSDAIAASGEHGLSHAALVTDFSNHWTDSILRN